MLHIAKNLGQLDFRQLMEVYAEGNRENAAAYFPELPEERGLLEAEQSFYQYLQECFFSTEGAVYAIWIAEGRYVSALRLEPYQDGFLLEALETAPLCRQKGYAKALIQAVLSAYPGERLYSHVRKRNLPSLRTHEVCGFQRILEHAVYADGSVLTNSCTYCYQG